MVSQLFVGEGLEGSDILGLGTSVVGLGALVASLATSTGDLGTSSRLGQLHFASIVSDHSDRSVAVRKEPEDFVAEERKIQAALRMCDIVGQLSMILCS